MEEYNHFTNDLHESLAQKAFWKSFNSKLSSKNLGSKAVDSIYGSDGIAQHFLDVFSSVVQLNSPNANARLHHAFTQKYYILIVVTALIATVLMLNLLIK